MGKNLCIFWEFHHFTFISWADCASTAHLFFDAHVLFLLLGGFFFLVMGGEEIRLLRNTSWMGAKGICNR